MIDKKKTKEAIRREAESIVALRDDKTSDNLEMLSLDEVKEIVYELEVHQIELKMQNEELITIQEELEKSKKRYFELYDMAPIAYCTLDENGIIKEVNFSMLKLLGLARDEVFNKALSNFIISQDQDLYYLFRKKFCASDARQECELRIKRLHKKSSWVYLAAQREENVVRLIIKDISERKVFEEKLELLASVFKNAGEAIMITELDGTIADVNETFTNITGYKKEEIVGKKPSFLSSHKQSKQYYRNMWNTLKKEGSWKGEIWNMRKSGQVYAEMLIINTVYDYHGEAKHYVALFSDITGIKEYENSLKNIAHYDQLTNLPNRVLFADRLENGMKQTKRNKQYLAVIFLDLDGFKEVNDNYGHEMGDKLLAILAENMQQELREIDTLARIGGDEFAAVLFDLANIADALPIITRLLETACEKIEIDDVLIQVSASLGVTMYPQTNRVDADQLLRQADQAMYQAKLSGKNCFRAFNLEENNLIRDRFEGIEQLRKGFLNKELVLYYQPKVNMRTGKVIGVEALMRWKHPQRGLVPPMEFLPLIEEHALSIEIGEWVIETALLQIKSWQEEGVSMHISVNLGARQLLEDGFTTYLKNILLKYPTVKANMLELEVLETSSLEDILKARYVMNACKDLGVSFSLDDFGTGYSSLTYLKQLPIKQIKIDQSFVLDMLNNPDDLSILEVIISLAEDFRYSVIAEGVETTEHAITLMQLGCELGQGYEIARPMPPESFISWIKEYKHNTSWQNQHKMNTIERQLFFVKVQHRTWIENIKTILNNKEKQHRKNHDIHDCHFKNWLEKGGKEYLGSNYKEIDLKHRNIHIFADELLDLHYANHTAQALDKLEELDSLRDELLEKLSVYAFRSL